MISIHAEYSSNSLEIKRGEKGILGRGIKKQMEYSRLDTPHLPKYMRKLMQRYYFYSYLQKFQQIFI